MCSVGLPSYGGPTYKSDYSLIWKIWTPWRNPGSRASRSTLEVSEGRPSIPSTGMYPVHTPPLIWYLLVLLDKQESVGLFFIGGDFNFGVDQMAGLCRQAPARCHVIDAGPTCHSVGKCSNIDYFIAPPGTSSRLI